VWLTGSLEEASQSKLFRTLTFACYRPGPPLGGEPSRDQIHKLPFLAEFGQHQPNNASLASTMSNTHENAQLAARKCELPARGDARGQNQNRGGEPLVKGGRSTASFFLDAKRIYNFLSAKKKDSSFHSSLIMSWSSATIGDLDVGA
jgi:hypothetical protein